MSFTGAFYKDLRLFFSRSGLFAIILPLLLLPALMLGVDGLTAANFVSAFPIAVRDEDDTVMSHSLVTQLGDIELFSQVRVLEDETDEEAVAGGAVAVATIPKDFFYDLYDMSDCPVDVTVNSARPLEAAIFSSVFRSVMGIISANHAAAVGTYTFAYGELTPELVGQMREESGDRLVYDALARQRFFTGSAAVQDTAGALTRRLGACVLGVLAMFFALTSAKTVPEERRLGVLPRLRAAGSGAAPFVLSKLLSALLLSAPEVILVSAALKTDLAYTAVVYFALLCSAFAMMSAPALAGMSAAGVQRLGNVVLLLSLTLGGVLWPVSVLPGPLRQLAVLSLPHYAHLALEARAAGVTAGETLGLLWPLLPLGLVPAALGAALRRFPRPEGRSVPGGPAALSLAAFKLRLAIGGPAMLILTLAAAVVCGLCAGALRSAGPAALRLGVWDRDGTQASRALAEALGQDEGVRLTQVGSGGRRALLTGELEGLVIIGPGYEGSLAGGAPALGVETSAASVSAQAVRELVAGKAVAQYRQLEAEADAETILGRTLTGVERARLREEIRRAEEDLPELYHMTYTSGAAPADPFAPSPMALGCLAALFTVLTAGAYTASPDAKSAARRLRSLPHGRALGLATDLAALTALGFAVMAAVLLTAGGGSILTALALALCDSALALLLTTVSSAEGRVDTLAPLTALLICVLGGCFMDLSALPVRTVTYISPAALAALPPSRSVPALLLYTGALIGLINLKKA